MSEKTPEYILQKLRARNSLRFDDKSIDDELNNLSPVEKLREVCAWELGDRSWADQVFTWARDCGIEINHDHNNERIPGQI